MTSRAHALALACLLSASLSAQDNLLTNGDFELDRFNPIGWTGSGPGALPRLDTWDVGGHGTSVAFGVNPGGVPYQVNTYVLSQSVNLNSGPYEIYADIACQAQGYPTQDAGLMWVKFNGVEVGRHSFGGLQPWEIRRNVICNRLSLAVSGPVTVEIGFERSFGTQAYVTPRHYVDHISVRRCAGPAFCIGGSRRPGDTVALKVIGLGNAAFAVFLSPTLAPRIQIPGMNGWLHLNPANMIFFYSGGLDSNGLHQSSFLLPPSLLAGVPLYFQAVHVPVVATPAIGVHHDYVLQR